MPSQSRILLIDANASDIELAESLLTANLPTAQLFAVTDATTLAAALIGPSADVAVVAPRLDWAATDKVLDLLARESPTTAIVLFGHESELVERCLNPGLALAGIALKSSAGFMALGDIVSAAMSRPVGDTALELADLPLAAVFITAEGRLGQANKAFISACGIDAEMFAETLLNALCADQQAQHSWREFRDGDTEHVELRLRLGADVIHYARICRDPARPRERRFLAILVAATATEINVIAPQGNEHGNREILDVALVFSHDLKEPLQQIMRIVRSLADPVAVDTQGASKKHARQLQACAERAGAMLESMLEYLAVTSRDEPPGLIDLNLCLEQALDNQRSAIDDCDAHIVSEQLPSIAGDAYQLLHLFQNLIGNAIKFRSRERPQVRIEAKNVGDNLRITFRDNGIGIDKAYRERVFEMGKRLHTRDEYPGSGIGLTLCRRITQRHGGSIRIEGSEQGGSSVIVELPSAPSHVTRLA